MPAIVIGLLLLGVCLVGGWYIDRLQKQTARIVSKNLSNLQAAGELEIRVRQLRFHSFVYLIDPKPEYLAPIEKDYERFEEALRDAKESANYQEQRDQVVRIENEYRKYRDEMVSLRSQAATMTRPQLAELADAHPINDRIVKPCQDLRVLNKNLADESVQESERVGRKVTLGMLILGLLGPTGGLIVGFGIARGLSRSIYQVSMRVHDMAQRLDQDAGSISIVADGDIRGLDRQLQHVLTGVEEVAQRLQRHQRDMLRAEQLSAVGQLAASIAHEVRNPLTAIKLLVEVSLRAKNPKSLTTDDLRVIHGEIARVESIVQNFLDFARLPTPQTAACDVREVITQAVELIQARARLQNVEIHLQVPKQPAPWDLDRNQVCTVLVNLFLNALDAMSSGGVLEIEMNVSAETGVRLSVADSGAGISEEMLGKLFTPFASTKATGTGLGLNLSQRIIEEHGGHLTAANRAEGGACFTIWLPSAATASRANGDHVGAAS